MAKKQPRPVSVVSPFGEDIDPEGLPQGRDAFYVQGYSDKRQQFDEDVREGVAPTPLQNRFQYVNIQRASGQPTKEKEGYYRARGYIPVMYEDCAKYGIDPTQSGFIKDADGTCRVGSQLLMVCPARKVAAHARDLDERNEALKQSAFTPLAEAVNDYNARNPGATKTEMEVDERLDDKPFAFETKLKKR